MAKTYTCKNCGKKSERIGVASECTQRLHIPSDNWDDLEVGYTLYGYCTECGTRIPDGALKRILGSAYTPTPDYRGILETLVNDVETEGCDGCGTVSVKVINKARKALGYKNG